MPTPAFEGHAAGYIGALAASGYLHAVKVLEVVGGTLLLSGRFPLVGLVMVTPVAVNIALFEIFLVHQPGLGIILALLCFFLVWAYRSYFAPLFTVSPRIG